MPTNNITAGNLSASTASIGVPSFSPPVILGDYVLDFGMATFHNNCDRIYVCTGPITDFASVVATAVGYKVFGAGNAFGGINNGSPSGRVVSSISFTDGSITANGFAICWAAVDYANSRLLAWGVLAGDVSVIAGQLFGLPSFVIHEQSYFSGSGIIVQCQPANSLATLADGFTKPALVTPLLTATALAAQAAALTAPIMQVGYALAAFSFQPTRTDALGTPVLTRAGPFALTATALASGRAALGVPQLLSSGGTTVTHGQQITLANVGRAGAAAANVSGYSSSLTTITGDQNYSTSQTFNNVNFSGIVVITGGNQVFNFCTFTAHPLSGNTDPGGAMHQYNGGSATGTVTCNWCDFDSGDRGSVGNFETEGFNAGVRTGAFTTDVNSWFQMTRCSFQGYGNGVSLDLWCAGPSGFTECWFGNLTFGSGGNTEPSHVDCIECYSSTNITIQRCRMMGDPTMTTDYYTSTLINCTGDWGNTPNNNPIIVRNCYTNGAAASAIVVAWGANGSYKHGVQFFGNYLGDESWYGRVLDLEGSNTTTGPINIAYDQTWWNANQLANLPGVILWAPDNVWAPNGEAVTNATTAPSGDTQAGLPHTPGAFIGSLNIYSGPVWIWTGKVLGPAIGTMTATPLAVRAAGLGAPVLTASGTTSGVYPGQTGNLVGHTHAPGYAGLTPWPGGSFVAGTVGSPTVYSFYDFDQGTGGTVINVNNVKFVGCRFQSNVLQDANVQILSVGNVTFDFCTISPRAALVSSIPNAAWPAAATGANVDINTSGCQAGECQYMIGSTLGYEYGIRMFPTGPITIKNCDIWGFGNAIDLHPATGDPLVLINNNWIHDAANPSSQGYHVDGPGYLEGGASPGNVTISNNTIASLGNTNGIALQAATNGYRNITLTGNYFTGFGNCTDICHDVAGSTNIIVTDNIWATDIQWTYVPLGMSSVLFTAANPTNSWQRNKLKVRPGTVPSPPTSTFAYTIADDGKFLWADQTLSTTDWRTASVPTATSLAVRAAFLGTPVFTMGNNRTLVATSLASKASTAAKPVFSGPTPPPPVGNYPGQSTNLVGHTHTPASPPAHWTGNGTWPGAYPGSVTAWTGGDASSSGTSTNYLIIAFKDFTNGLVITGSYIKFIGCRFQMNSIQSAGGQAECIGGSHHEFYYCSFVPLVSLHSQPPNGGGYTTWPTGGTGANLISDTPGSGNANPATKPYCIPYTEGYQYAIRCYDNGNILADHCDFWGWGNCIVTGSNNCSFTECWVHDARYGGDNGEDHSDGIGYIDSTSAPTFITIDHCTIVSFGLEDCIAMQGSTTGYHNWTISNCYLSGFDYVLFIMSTPTNVQVINNIVSGDIPWTFTPASASPVSWWAGRPNGNIWSNNTLQINAGDVDKADTASGYVHYTSGQNGYYIYPDATYHLTDLV